MSFNLVGTIVCGLMVMANLLFAVHVWPHPVVYFNIVAGVICMVFLVLMARRYVDHG